MPENKILTKKLRENALKKIIYPVWILFVLTIVLNIFVNVPLRYQFLPLILSFLVLGLPHGAVDHLLIPKSSNKSLSAKWLTIVSLSYLFLGALYLIAWYLNALISFIFFIIITWFHWGEGELYIIRELFVDFEISRLQKALEIIVRGGAPMILPLVAFPEHYRFVAESLISIFSSPGLFLSAEVFFEDFLRLLLLIIYLSVSSILLLIIYSKSNSDFAWMSSLAEISILLVFFLTVPPILAVGLYFCFWHALRHAFRYSMLDENSFRCLEKGNIFPAVKSFSYDAAPLTLGALLILLSLYLIVPKPPARLEEHIGLYLVLISILTLPHIFFTLLIDRKQGLI